MQVYRPYVYQDRLQFSERVRVALKEDFSKVDHLRKLSREEQMGNGKMNWKEERETEWE